jgi:hypothetical protein
MSPRQVMASVAMHDPVSSMQVASVSWPSETDEQVPSQSVTIPPTTPHESIV